MTTHRHILLIRSTTLDDWRIMRSPECSVNNPECDLVESAARSFLRPSLPRGFALRALHAFGQLFADVLRIPIKDERRPTGYFWASVDGRGEFEPGRRLTQRELEAHVPGYHRPHPNCRCTVAAIV